MNASRHFIFVIVSVVLLAVCPSVQADLVDGSFNAGCSMSFSGSCMSSVGFSAGSVLIIDDSVSLITEQSSNDDLFIEFEVADSSFVSDLCLNHFAVLKPATFTAASTTAKSSYTIPTAISQGDFNLDGVVSEPDLELLKSSWGTYVQACTGTDASGDGFVGGDDLDTVRSNWGKTIESGFVPEPNIAFSLLMLGAVLLTKRNRK